MKKHVVITDINRSHNYSPEILNNALKHQVLNSYVDEDIYLTRPYIEGNMLMFYVICENYFNDKALARIMLSYMKENITGIKNSIVMRLPKSEQSPVTVYEEKKERII